MLLAYYEILSSLFYDLKKKILFCNMPMWNLGMSKHFQLVRQNTIYAKIWLMNPKIIPIGLATC